jgi:hypothetical protein
MRAMIDHLPQGLRHLHLLGLEFNEVCPWVEEESTDSEQDENAVETTESEEPLVEKGESEDATGLGMDDLAALGLFQNDESEDDEMMDGEMDVAVVFTFLIAIVYLECLHAEKAHCQESISRMYSSASIFGSPRST